MRQTLHEISFRMTSECVENGSPLFCLTYKIKDNLSWAFRPIGVSAPFTCKTERCLLIKNKNKKSRRLCTSTSLIPTSSNGMVPEELLTFLGFVMKCGVQSLLGTSGIYAGTYLLGLFGGLFSDAMGYCLPIVSCEMTRTK